MGDKSIPLACKQLGIGSSIATLTELADPYYLPLTFNIP